MQSHWLPFARLNLMRNPFGELSREDRMFAAVVDVERWLPKLQTERIALQFLGECGRGKSTHLLALLAHCPQGEYVYLPEDGPLPQIPQGRPLFIDESQRLPRWKRWQVFRRRVPLVLGTHTDLRKPLERAGYQVESVCVAQLATAERVQVACNRRIELARLNAGLIPQVTLQRARELIERFGNDMRSMETQLYHDFEMAARGEKDAVWQSVS